MIKKIFVVAITLSLLLSGMLVAVGGEAWEGEVDESVDSELEPTGLADSPWPTFGHNQKNTGRSPYDTSHVDGTEKWSYSTGIVAMFMPTVSEDGTIYVSSLDFKLHAINSDNGEEKWSFETTYWMSSSPVLGNDNTIYVGSSDGEENGILYAIDSDGTEEWSFETEGFVSSPAIDEYGNIYVSSSLKEEGGYLYSINPDGTENWRCKVDDPATMPYSPTIDDGGTVYFGSENDKLYAISPDGTEKWSFNTEGSVSSTPAVGDDGTIYVGSRDNNLYAVNPDGSEKWSFETGGSVGSSPTIGADETIYFGSRDSNLYAVNPDGTEKWSFETGRSISYSSPAIGDDGTIYIGSDDRSLYAIYSEKTEGQAGTERWNFKIVDQVSFSPSIGDEGTIYFGSLLGALYAVNPDGTEKWSQGGPVSSSPAIGKDGTIYVGSHTGKIYALNRDGKEKWSFNTGGGIYYSSPAISDEGTIYIGSFDGNLYAVNQDGTEKWRFETGNRIFSSPTIGEDGTIYVGSADPDEVTGELHAVHPEDGTEKWSFETREHIISSPAIAEDGTVYIGSHDNNLYAINPDGTEKWAFPTGASVISSPSIGDDGTIYIGSYDNNLYAVNPDGSERWSFETSSSVESPAAIGEDGTIYVGCRDNNLYAVNPDGTEKWTFENTGYGVYNSLPAIGDEGTIYFGSADNHLYSVNPDGTERWSFEMWSFPGEILAYSSPVIDEDGTIYAGSADGSLYAIGDEPQEHTLTLEEPVGEGTVKVDGQEVTSWPYQGDYEHGTEVGLKATPAEGWYFDGWTGTDKTGEEITINMDEDKEITSHFTDVDETDDLRIVSFKYDDFVMGRESEIELVLKNQGSSMFEEGELEIETAFVDTYHGRGANSFWVSVMEDELALQENQFVVDIPKLEPGEETQADLAVELSVDVSPSLHLADTFRISGDSVEDFSYDEVYVMLSVDDGLETLKTILTEILIPAPPLAMELNEEQANRMDEEFSELSARIKDDDPVGAAYSTVDIAIKWHTYELREPEETAEMIIDAVKSYIDSGLATARSIVWAHNTLVVAIEEMPVLRSLLPPKLQLLLIKCPVEPEIQCSAFGNILSPETNEIDYGRIEDIEDGYLVLLGGEDGYEMNLKGEDTGTVSFYRSTDIGDELLIENAEFDVNEDSMATATILPGERCEELGVDLDGDGDIDEEIETSIKPESEYQIEDPDDEERGWLPYLGVGVIALIVLVIAVLLIKKRGKSEPSREEGYQQRESISRDELDQGLEQSKGPPAQKTSEQNLCRDCGGEMRYIEEYERWYCDRCQEYK